MAIKHNGYTFTCAQDDRHPSLVVSDARTERTAIERARAKHWDIVRLRVVSGLAADRVARTVRLAFCPGCVWGFGVRSR